MPFLTAQKIHNGHRWLPGGTVIDISGEGEILSIMKGQHPEAVFYEGIITPGFVNVHCHLELSHMKGLVPEHTGLIPFLKTIPKHRNDFTEEEKRTARHKAYHELLGNGVVAVGDIANTTDTIDVRALRGMHMHTFIEAIGFNEERADKAFGYALQNYYSFASQTSTLKKLSQSIVPHAPYSVSASLLRLINAHNHGNTIAIHNQESRDEDLFFKSKVGAIRDLLDSLGIDDSSFKPSGKSSIQTYLEHISPDHEVVFVHNTYTNREDVQFAKKRFNELYWCLCPNANLYIENTLPDIEMLVDEGLTICIGTDSLASNNRLSILSELYSIKHHYPELEWEQLICWGTLHGASALQMQDTIGSIEIGKKPGLIQIIGLGADAPLIKRIV